MYVCKLKIVYFPYYSIPGIGSFKKKWLKQQDSNLASFNYESGILPFQPTLIKYIRPYNVEGVSK